MADKKDETIVTSNNVTPRTETPDAPEAGRQEVVPEDQRPTVVSQNAADARMDVSGGGASLRFLEKIKQGKKVPVWLREPLYVQIGPARFTVYGAEDITEPVMVYEAVAAVIANKREQERIANVKSRELRASSNIINAVERGAEA